MDSPKVENLAQIIDWLEGKPTDWKTAIYVRSALRALPTMADTSEQWLRFYAVTIFRADALSWTALNFQKIGKMKAAAEASQLALTEAIRRAYDDNLAWDALAGALGPNLLLSGIDADEVFNWKSPTGLQFKASDAAYLNLLEPIEKDLAWLQRHQKEQYVTRVMSRRSIWFGKPPEDWQASWVRLRAKLLEADPDYSVWVDWYERRIKGRRAAFDIPGDKGRVEDKKILRRLAEATNEDFWGKGHEYVNATLKGWLDEARARVAPPPIVGEASGTLEITGSATAELGALPTPPQEASAIAYGVNERGKLDRLPNSYQAHLRDVPDQRRAYHDLRETAAELLSEGQRLGHRLNRALERFLQSLPEGFEDAEAYLVWRDANALRRMHRAHREAAKSPEPDEARLEPVVAEGLGGLLDLYNNFAFADDGLRAKDEARIAPQERASAEAEAKAAMPLVEAILANPEIATPEALDDIVADAENAELPADDPYSAQVLQQSNESRKNFVAAALAWGATTLASPKQVGKAVAIGSVTGAAGVVGKVVMAAIIGTDFGPLLPFIAANAEILQHYVAIAFPSFEHLPSLIDQLKLLWARLRN